MTIRKRRTPKMLFCLLPAVFGGLFLYGCAPLVVGGAALGAGSGTYAYVNGELKTDYYSSFDKVWAACEKTIADMRGMDVEPYKEIGLGTISAFVDDQKVQINVNYKAKNVTTVAVRVGLIGNKTASQLIHDKIGDFVAKN